MGACFPTDCTRILPLQAGEWFPILEPPTILYVDFCWFLQAFALIVVNGWIKTLVIEFVHDVWYPWQLLFQVLRIVEQALDPFLPITDPRDWNITPTFGLNLVDAGKYTIHGSYGW